MTFSASDFISASTTEAATKRPPLPVGDYLAVITKLDAKEGEIKKGERQGQTWHGMNVSLEVDLSQYPDAQQRVGQPKVTLFHLVMFDVNQAGNGLDWSPGKNNGLRRYREALDMNTPGQPFVPTNMVGRPIRVRVKHESYEGEIQERVDTVSKV